MGSNLVHNDGVNDDRDDDEASDYDDVSDDCNRYGGEEVLEALLEYIPELEWDGSADMEEVDEGGVHLWGTSDRQLAPGTSRAVELSVAYGIALEANGWTLLDPEPQCTLPAGTIVDKSGQVVGDPFECGFEAENDDGR